MRAKQVTPSRHYGDRRIGPHQLEPGRQVGHDKHSREELLDRRGELRWRFHKFKSRCNGPQALIAPVCAGPATRFGGPADPPGPAGTPRPGTIGDGQIGPAGVAGPQHPQDVGGRPDVTHDNRGGGAAQRGGDCF